MRRCVRRTRPQRRSTASQCVGINRCDSSLHDYINDCHSIFCDDSSIDHIRILRHRRSVDFRGIVGFNFDTIDHLSTNGKQPCIGVNGRKQFEHPGNEYRPVIDFSKHHVGSGFDARHHRDPVGQWSGP